MRKSVKNCRHAPKSSLQIAGGAIFQQLWVSWKKFVEFITANRTDKDEIALPLNSTSTEFQHPVKLAGHLKPVTENCHCGLNTNHEYIIKQENYVDEMQFLLDIMGVNITVPHKNKSSKEELKKSSDYFEKFCGFGAATIDVLHRIYHDDYLAFGYEKFDKKKHCNC